MVCARRLLNFVLLPAIVAVQGKKQEKEPKREIEKLVELRTHSLFAPYIDQDLQNRWWDFGADSYVNTNKHIRLTRALPSQMGWLWSRLPITAQNFRVEVEFRISGEETHMYGDGLAVWLTKDRAQPGPVFGSIDKFTGLGLFIDTFANSRHNYTFPRAVCMLGDGKTSYDLANDGETNAIGACSPAIRGANVATKLMLTHINGVSLDVKFQYKSWDEWTDCFVAENITLPKQPFLGFSALTGDVFDAHDIISVTTSAVVLSGPTGSTRSQLTTPPLPGSKPQFTFKSLLKIIFFGAICALVVAVVRAYAMQRGGLRVAGVDLLNRRGGLGTFERQSSKRF